MKQNYPEKRYENAIKRVKEKKEFYSNFISWILVSAFLLGINLLTSTQHYWFLYPFLGWGLGVAFHAAKVFGAPGFSDTWEERKLKEEMKRIEAEDDDMMELDDLDRELDLEEVREPSRKWSEDDLV